MITRIHDSRRQRELFVAENSLLAMLANPWVGAYCHGLAISWSSLFALDILHYLLAIHVPKCRRACARTILRFNAVQTRWKSEADWMRQKQYPQGQYNTQVMAWLGASFFVLLQVHPGESHLNRDNSVIIGVYLLEGKIGL